MNIEIADRLVKLRKEHNLSQEALAAKLGLSRQAVSKWERAEASPDTDNLVALAELYGVQLDEILNGTKPQAEETVEQNSRKKRAPLTKTQLIGHKMVKFPFPIIAAALYLMLGFCFNNWHPGWLVLLFIPAYYCIGGGLCCRTKKAMLLTMPIPFIVVMIYLLFGFTMHWWHPQWIIFLLIPLYYWIISVFYKEKKKAPAESENVPSSENANNESR